MDKIVLSQDESREKPERKNGVFGNEFPESNSSLKQGDRTPPPPYLPESEPSPVLVSRRRVSCCPTESATEVPYTVPKDMSEGLQNPVFTCTTNPDEDVDDPNANTIETTKNRCNNNNGVAATTFSPNLTSGYKNSISDFDAEKGPPFSLSRDSSAKNNNKNKNGDNARTKNKGVDKEYKGFKRYLGLLLTLSASFCFSMVVLFVKVLNKDYGFDAYGASFWRYTGTVVPTIPLLLFYECGPGKTKQASVFTGVWPVFKNDNWKTWIGLLSRGLIGSTSVILRYYALHYLTIGDTSVITYSTPVLVTVLAHFFLGERCGVFPIIIAFVTLCGVVIVTKPPILTGSSEFDTNTLIGTGLACGSLFCSAIIVIITRKIREVHFTVMTLVFGIIGVGQALALIHFLGDFSLPTEATDSFLVAGVSSLSFLGQMAIVLALKFEQAGPVALIRSCDVLFGFLFQFIFLNEIPDQYSAIGAIIVLTGVLSTGLRKWLNTLPAEDVRRKKFWFILK